MASTTKHAPKSVRILLAEDHHINMKVACAVLRKCGHKDITICKDGVDVIEKVASMPSGLDAFDIVLMDLHMPRMEEWSACASCGRCTLSRRFPSLR